MQSLNIKTDSSPEQEAIKDYLVWSIISILLCTIGGIVAMMYSIKTGKYKKIGNYDAARESSRKAFIWLMISYILGGLIFLVRLGASAH